MKKTIVILLSLIFIFTLSSCMDNNGDTESETTTQNETTVGSTQTEQTTTEKIDYKPTEFTPVSLTVLVNDPIAAVPEKDYDLFAGNGNADIIGKDDSVYLRYNGLYYLVWDIGRSVSQNCNIYFIDIDNSGSEEIFIDDLTDEKTKVLAYNTSLNAYDIVLDAGTLNISDLNDDLGYELYSADKKQFPYSLFIYYFTDGKFLIQDVSAATGNEYSVISQRKYIFAGTGDDLSMYTLTGMDLNKIDASLYLASDSIIADSGRQLLTYDDLKKVQRYWLTYAVNEIYARHGYISDDENMQQYFEDKPWYRADGSFDMNVLTEIEKANVELINSYLALLAENVIKYGDMRVSLDMNGDGKTEDVSLEINEENYTFTLKIDDKTVDGSGEAMIKAVYVLDLDTSDSFKEIAVTDAGPSDDYSTYVYSYDGSDIKLMGRVEGSGDGITVIGDGSLITYRRSGVLQTWFYVYSFITSEDRMLTGIDRDEYAMGTFVILKKDLDVYVSKTGSEIKFVIKAGEPALIVSSDDIKTCLIKNSSGDEGYFYLKNFNEINNTGIASGDYFDGLVFAD
jgi:hypothetical protein